MRGMTLQLIKFAWLGNPQTKSIQWRVEWKITLCRRGIFPQPMVDYRRGYSVIPLQLLFNNEHDDQLGVN